MRISLSESYGPPALTSFSKERRLRWSRAHLPRAIRRGAVSLLMALCVGAGAAHAQSTHSTATIVISLNSPPYANPVQNYSYYSSSQVLFYNYGTISVTINGTETESAPYYCGYVGGYADYVANLASAINRNSPYVTASVQSDDYFNTGGSILLTSKGTGSGTNYSLSVSATWDTNDYDTNPDTGVFGPDFTAPGFIPSAPANMSGGH